MAEPASNPTLLALPFLQGLERSRPDCGRARDGQPGLRYEGLRHQRFDRAVTVYAAPTSAGWRRWRASTPPADADSFSATCDQIANTLALGGSAKAGELGPSKDYAATVSKTLGALSKADKAGSAKLAKAKTQKAQASAARSLSGAFAKAAKAMAGADVRPADKNANAALVRGLRKTSTAYSKLAASAASNSRAAYAKAKSEVTAGRKAIGAALGQLKVAGYDVKS